MLIGHYQHSLDPKKRVSIPSKWRGDFANDKLIITTGLDTSLFIFSELEWKNIATQLASSGFLDADTRQFSRFMLANAYEVSIDSHGRILVPEPLAQHAKLKNDVTLSGVYSRAELWDTNTYEKVMKEVGKNAEDLALKMSRLQGYGGK